MRTTTSTTSGAAADQESASKAWSDILFVEKPVPTIGAWVVEKPEPTISYRTGMTVYEESLTNGRFVGRGWNGSGYVSFYDGRIKPERHPAPQAFWLEMDGQLLASDWEFVGFDKKPTGKDKPTDIHATVTLRHKIRPVTVTVHTKLDGTPIITRWLEVTNTGKTPAALSAAFSWSGVLQRCKRWQSHMGNSGLPLYSLGYFDDSHWENEGDFHWFDLPAAGYRVDGRYRRDRYRHPMFVLRNNATGEHFIGQLA